jgi:hypothetical protein
MAKTTDPTIINPSKLRHLVTIRQETRGNSASYNPWTVTDSDLTVHPEDGWSDYYTGYASIENIGGLTQKEVLKDGKLDPVNTHLIKMRWSSTNANIVPGMQVHYNGTQYRIQVAQNWDELRIAWLLLCIELPKGVA